MRLSQIYTIEPEYRKDYISEWIKDTLNINLSTPKDEYKEEISNLIDKDIDKLTLDQLNLYNYFQGEKNKTKFINDTFKRMKDQLKTEKIQKLRQEKIRFKKVKNYETTEKKKVFGYIKGKKVKARVEKYLDKGKLKYRFRDKKGRFVSLSK